MCGLIVATSRLVNKRLTLNNQANFTYLVLNYKRLRFFPLIRDNKGSTLFNFSLGILSKFFKKGKSFIKNKAVYLVGFSLIRKILMYSSVEDLILIINRVPKYFQEFISTLHTTTVSIYKDPFSSVPVLNEPESSTFFDFKYVQVLTYKSNGYVKMGKKGRLKRKIAKRVYSSNRVID